jgi:hypothetical protein
LATNSHSLRGLSGISKSATPLAASARASSIACANSAPMGNGAAFAKMDGLPGQAGNDGSN